jgi:hypothetical protein
MHVQNETEAPAEPQEPTGPDELDLIAAEAEGLTSSATTQHQEQAAQREAAQQSQTEQELKAALEMVRMMAGPAFAWWPEFGECWSDKQLTAISAAGADVMQRHGWTMGEALSKYGPYLALAGATLPPSLATYQAIKARQEEAERQAARERRPMAGPMQ